MEKTCWLFVSCNVYIGSLFIFKKLVLPVSLNFLPGNVSSSPQAFMPKKSVRTLVSTIKISLTILVLEQFIYKCLFYIPQHQKPYKRHINSHTNPQKCAPLRQRRYQMTFLDSAIYQQQFILPLPDRTAFAHKVVAVRTTRLCTAAKKTFLSAFLTKVWLVHWLANWLLQLVREEKL